MTTPGVRDMPAGREIDALVAERVMGWRWAMDECECPSLNEGRCERPDGVIVHGFMPSRDIAAAWLVVECLRGMGWDINLNAINKDSNGMTWCCWLARGGDNTPHFGTAAAIAICRAALAAVCAA